MGQIICGSEHVCYRYRNIQNKIDSKARPQKLKKCPWAISEENRITPIKSPTKCPGRKIQQSSRGRPTTEAICSNPKIHDRVWPKKNSRGKEGPIGTPLEHGIRRQTGERTVESGRKMGRQPKNGPLAEERGSQSGNKIWSAPRKKLLIKPAQAITTSGRGMGATHLREGTSPAAKNRVHPRPNGDLRLNKGTNSAGGSHHEQQHPTR